MTYLSLIELRKLTEIWYQDSRYGEKSYTEHLDGGREVLRKFEFPDTPAEEQDGPIQSIFDYLHAAFELHDLFEDTDISPGYVLSQGVDPWAVCLALLVTDEHGLSRKERKARSYPIIASSQESILIKLADRITNVEHNGKLEMYRQEYSAFRKALMILPEGYCHETQRKINRMWKHLDQLLK